MAFAGFSPGEAEGLRRAMSRKRSEAAIMAHHDRFVRGRAGRARRRRRAELAERVWNMVVGFSGFGFPKAHGAAFGLLAYQSAWLRVHRPLEFLCALLDEQPMGFYPSDALIHEAQRRDIEIRAPDIGSSEVGCRLEEHDPAAADAGSSRPRTVRGIDGRVLCRGRARDDALVARARYSQRRGRRRARRRVHADQEPGLVLGRDARAGGRRRAAAAPRRARVDDRVRRGRVPDRRGRPHEALALQLPPRPRLRSAVARPLPELLPARQLEPAVVRRRRGGGVRLQGSLLATASCP